MNQSSVREVSGDLQSILKRRAVYSYVKQATEDSSESPIISSMREL
jgi:hypothetical protein